MARERIANPLDAGSNPAACSNIKGQIKMAKCIHCKARAKRNRKQCGSCLDKQKVRNTVRKVVRKELGLCLHCAEPAKNIHEGKLLCKAHLKSEKERVGRFVAEHKLQGLCIRCYKPAENGIFCVEHKIKSREYASKYYKVVYYNRKEKGLCTHCGGEPVLNRTVCQLELVARAARARTWRAKNHYAAA